MDNMKNTTKQKNNEKLCLEEIFSQGSRQINKTHKLENLALVQVEQ